MPGSKLASRSPWNRCFKKLMPKSCPNLKSPWNRVCIRRMFPHLGKSNVRKNPSTVALYPSCFRGWEILAASVRWLFSLCCSGWERERKRERKRGDINDLSVHQWLRSAIRDSQQPSTTALCGTTGRIRLKNMSRKKRRGERRPNDVANYSKDQIQRNIAIPMRFTRNARLFKSSAPQLFTMISNF